jgi:LacI family transcriptional regulator/LacI family asc operon transcriptional repressor
VAKKANVSIATVSRVLNSSEHVSDKTRKKVLEIIKQEEYIPNAFARGLGLNTMQMIGVMCTDVTDNFYSTALGYIEKFLRAQGKDVVLCCTGNNLEDKKKNLSYLVSRRVDAVILIGSAFKEEKDNSHIKEAAEQIPVIIINGYIHLKNVYL